MPQLIGPKLGNSPFCESVMLTERSVFLGALLQDVRYGLPHAGQKPHIHDRGCRDAGPGRGIQHDPFQHRGCRVAAFSVEVA